MGPVTRPGRGRSPGACGRSAMSSPVTAGPLPVLLLTTSPLLRAAIVRLLRAGTPGSEAFVLHTAGGRERDLTRARAEIAPHVVLVPIAAATEGGDPRALALIAQLVRQWSVPILTLSLGAGTGEHDEEEIAAACRRHGAVEYLPHAQWASDPTHLRTRIAMAARIKILRPLDTAAPETPGRPIARPATVQTGALVVVGASAGGPAALRELLAALPPHFPAPLVIVQHLPPNFGAALAADLSRFAHGDVTLAAVGDILAPGRFLLVPGRQALTIEGGRVVALPDAMAEGVHGQAIDRTMLSVAAAYGTGAYGVILSGMGEDGVRGLTAIKAGGGRTFGQDAGSSQVYGMPRRAAEAGVLEQIGPPAILGNLLGRALGRPHHSSIPAGQPRAAL
jgi:two-component system chemotaxis response regulator CheB